MKAPDTLWELVFLMVILKIPIAYLCYVVWYAIRAEPRRGRGDPALVRVTPDLPPPGYDHARRLARRRPPRPHGGPARVYARTGAGSIAGKAGAARPEDRGSPSAPRWTRRPGAGR